MNYQSFSQRQGFIKVDKTIQLDGMTDELRNSLWNLIKEFYFDSNIEENNFGNRTLVGDRLEKILYFFIRDYLKEPTDSLSHNWEEMYQRFKEHFYQSDFNVCYDLIEFFSTFYEVSYVNYEFINKCNVVLERELSGYRFIDGRLAPISSAEEIDEVEEALDFYHPVREHLQKALVKLADRESPDYKNSIKESISAVESLCSKVSGKNTLGAALKEIESQGQITIHPALKQGFKNIYGYTSDEGGIRHANKYGGGNGVGFEDAKYMLVCCSAFINYLKVKVDKSGIKL